MRGGNVIDSTSEDPNVLGLRKFVGMISEDERLEATAVQTVGEKGWDGFVIAIVKTLLWYSGKRTDLKCSFTVSER